MNSNWTPVPGSEWQKENKEDTYLILKSLQSTEREINLLKL